MSDMVDSYFIETDMQDIELTEAELVVVTECDSACEREVNHEDPEN